MDTLQVIAARRSIRAYESRPVEEEKLEAILEAARQAPTAHDFQPFRVVVFRTEGRREEFLRFFKRDWLTAGPLALLVCSVPAEAWVRKDGKSYADVDAAIVMEHVVLAATALGLGTCWCGAFDAALAREVLGLEPGWEPLAFTPLGYPAESPEPRPRRPLAELAVRK